MLNKLLTSYWFIIVVITITVLICVSNAFIAPFSFLKVLASGLSLGTAVIVKTDLDFKWPNISNSYRNYVLWACLMGLILTWLGS